MSEEQTVQPGPQTAAATPSKEQTAFTELQNEYLKICAQIGETAYLMWKKRQEVKTLFSRVKKIDFKAQTLVAAAKKKEGKKTAV